MQTIVDHTAGRTDPPSQDSLLRWTRWVARGLAVVMIGVVALFMFGEGTPNPLTLTLEENLLMLALLLTLVGLAVGWRWEGIGGLTVVGSVLLFEIINAVASGRWRFGPLEPFFYLAGLLYLFAWWRATHGKPRQSTPS